MNEDINNFPKTEPLSDQATSSQPASSTPLTPTPPSKAKKANNPFLISTIVLAILLVGASGYIVYDALADKKQDDTPQQLTPAPEVEKEAEEESSAAKYHNLDLSADKDLDAKEDSQLTLTPNDFAYGISLVKDEDKSIKLSYIPSRLAAQNILGADSKEDNELKTITLSAANDILALEIAEFDQNLSTPRVVATLEGGKLAWLSYDEIFNQGKTELVAVEDVEQVLKLQSVKVKDGAKEYTDTIAIRNDGQFYRLSEHLAPAAEESAEESTENAEQ